MITEIEIKVDGENELQMTFPAHLLWMPSSTSLSVKVVVQLLLLLSLSFQLRLILDAQHH